MTSKDAVKEYQVVYSSGSGQIYDEGLWKVKKTPKTTTVEKVREGCIFEMYSVGQKFRVGLQTGNPVKNEYGDGEFTVYFGQAGIPYVFTPKANK